MNHVFLATPCYSNSSAPERPALGFRVTIEMLGYDSLVNTQPQYAGGVSGNPLQDRSYYLSEDYAFCRRWRSISGRLWLDTIGELTHIGPHEFAGRPGLR